MENELCKTEPNGVLRESFIKLEYNSNTGVFFSFLFIQNKCGNVFKIV